MKTRIEMGRLVRGAALGALALTLVLVGGAFAATSAHKVSKKKAVPAVTPMEKPTSLTSNAPPEVKAILDKVEDAQTSVKDVQMDLKMDVKDSVSGQKQTVRGVVKMKMPGKVFVHYTKPTEQFLYIDGSKLVMYQPESGMAFKQSTEKGQPAYLGVGKQLRMYSGNSRVSIMKETGSEVVLLFVPDQGESQFERMKVTVRKKDWWPGKVEIESGSMKSVAEFQKPRFNEGIEDSTFKFTPPEGTSIVEGQVF